MANIPEFISVLRRIRDEIYPEVEATYENAVALKAAVDAGMIELNEDLGLFAIDYTDFKAKYTQIDALVSSAATSAGASSANATAAAASALTATTKSNEIKGITAQANTLTSGSQATVSYNPTDGKFTFGIPVGSKGDKGDSFTVNAIGLTAGRSAYNTQATGFSYLDVSLALIYFKLSSTSGDWSVGSPFGKGDTGAKGADGTGITNIAFISTTDSSGLPSVAGAKDTYRVTLSNSTTYDFAVKNGIALDDTVLVHKSGAETLNDIKTFTSSPLVPTTITSDSSTKAASTALVDNKITDSATTTNTASKIVKRDASGNFSAGTITATLNGNALSATTATTAANASKLNGQTFNWSGQGGQPNWVYGGNDGTNLYVYNPSNFNVNYANSAGYAGSIPSGAGDIGTYAFLSKAQQNSSINTGELVAGSNLRYSGVNTPNATTSYAVSGGLGGAPAGTWRAMGHCAAWNGGAYPSTLFIRIG